MKNEFEAQTTEQAWWDEQLDYPAPSSRSGTPAEAFLPRWTVDPLAFLAMVQSWMAGRRRPAVLAE